MKFERNFFVACRQAIKDANSSNISLIEVFEGIKAGDNNNGLPPVGFGPFFLVARFTATGVKKNTPNKLPIEIKVKKPSGTYENNPQPVVGAVDLNPELKTQRLGLIVQVPLMIFNEIGTFVYELYVQGELIDSTELMVEGGSAK